MSWNDLVHNPDFRFCDDTMINKKTIVRFLTGRVFGQELTDVLTRRYELMNRHYNDNDYNEPNWHQDGLRIGSNVDWYNRAAALDIGIDRFELGNPIRQIVANYFNCGHDLPVWMRIGDVSRPRVMIIGQDPLREPRVEQESISLLTPWSCHSYHYRQGAGTSVRNVIAQLIEASGCEVYLTDYTKVYFSDRIDATNHPAFENRVAVYNNLMGQGRTTSEVIQNEIDIVDPILIITLGGWGGNLGQAFPGIEYHWGEFMLQTYNNRSVITLHHPQRAPQGYFREMMPRIAAFINGEGDGANR